MIMQYGFYTDSLITFGKYENYKCNANGFRTHEFNDWYNYCLVLGESNVFGIDVPDGKTLCDQLEKNVKTKIYNLGHPGASCEECVRILYSFSSTPTPKKVIIVWPYFLRRNHQDLEKLTRITGSDDPKFTKYIIENTPDMDIAHFLQQVFFAEQWCKWRGSELYHFLISKHDSNLLTKRGKTFERLFLHSFENHARDLGDLGGHFGSGAHRAFADYIKASCF